MGNIILPQGIRMEDLGLSKATSMAEVASARKRIEAGIAGAAKGSSIVPEHSREDAGTLHMQIGSSLADRIRNAAKSKGTLIVGQEDKLQYAILLDKLQEIFDNYDREERVTEEAVNYKLHNDIGIDDECSFDRYNMKVAHFIMHMNEALYANKITNFERAIEEAGHLCLLGSGLTVDLELAHYRATKLYNSMHETLDLLSEGMVRKERSGLIGDALRSALDNDREKTKHFAAYVAEKFELKGPLPLDQIAIRPKEFLDFVMATKQQFMDHVRQAMYR